MNSRASGQGIITAADCICPLLHRCFAAMLASGHIPISSACNIIIFFPAGHPSLSAHVFGIFDCCSVEVIALSASLFSFFLSPHPIRKKDRQRLMAKQGLIIFFIVVDFVVYRYLLNHCRPSPYIRSIGASLCLALYQIISLGFLAALMSNLDMRGGTTSSFSAFNIRKGRGEICPTKFKGSIILTNSLDLAFMAPSLYSRLSCPPARATTGTLIRLSVPLKTVPIIPPRLMP